MNLPKNIAWLSLLGLLGLLVMGCPEPESGGGNQPFTNASNGASTDPEQPQTVRNPNDARFSIVPGNSVTLSGTFRYEGESAGNYRIDVQKKEGSAAPMLVHAVEIDKPGDFAIEIPKNYGTILLLGFVDINSDGPSGDDPSGYSDSHILVGEEDITGVVLEVALGNPLQTPPPPGGPPAGGGSPTEPPSEDVPQPAEEPPPQDDAPPPDVEAEPPSDD